MTSPLSVLNHYSPALVGLRWHRVVGGFSGADVWRGDDDSGSPIAALKSWPAEFPPARLSRIHAWMAHAARLPFIPTIIRAVEGGTVVTESGRAWDMTRWMPGAPRVSPNELEVEAACAAVASLHRVWSDLARQASCPGVLNRLRVLREWHSAPVFPQASPGFSPGLNSLLRRAADVVRSTVPATVQELERWGTVSLRVQPCVRDLRGEHVLFTESEVTGIVDFGAMAEDHPAFDLARLLGDYAAGNETLFAFGLRAYRAAGGELDIPDQAVRDFAHIGALCSVIMWLVHLLIQRRTYPDTLAVEARIGSLIRRIEQFAPA